MENNVIGMLEEIVKGIMLVAENSIDTDKMKDFVTTYWSYFNENPDKFHKSTLDWFRIMSGKYELNLPIDKAELIEKSVEFNITKSNEELGVIYGTASVAAIEDTQGDIIDALDLRKASHDFINSSRSGDIDHDYIKQGNIVESVIIDEDLIKAIKDDKIVKNTWFIGYKPIDPNIAQQAKDGKFVGFSIGGLARREDV